MSLMWRPQQAALLYDDYVWVSLRNAMKANKKSKTAALPEFAAIATGKDVHKMHNIASEEAGAGRAWPLQANDCHPRH